jgi:hypothetical protein
MYHRSRLMILGLVLYVAIGSWPLPSQAQLSPQRASEDSASRASKNRRKKGVEPQAPQEAADAAFGNPSSYEHVSVDATGMSLDQAQEVDASIPAPGGGRVGLAPVADGDVHTDAIGLVISATFDSSITGNPSSAAIQAMINQAVTIYQSLYKDPITVSILFRYSTTGPSGTPLSGGTLAQSSSVIYTVPWTTFISALTADATTANDTTANSTLPVSSLSTNMIPSSANGRAVGLNTPPAMFSDGHVAAGGPFDGIVTLNSSQAFQFTRPVTSGNFDALRATEHEMDEVLGLGSTVNTGLGDLRPQDLYSWSAPGTRNLTTSGSRYFSINGGTTNIVGFNQNAGGDSGDWLSGSCPQVTPFVQNAFGCAGQMADVLVNSPEGINLDVIGYNLMQSVTGGTDTIGLYDPVHAAFFLRNTNNGGIADVSFMFGPAGLGWVPIVGDWDGNGTSTIGLYDPAHAAFFLRNSNNSGVADISFSFGPAGLGWIPLVGDWNGDGVDTIGLYDPAHAAFFLRNSNNGGVADISFAFGPAGLGWIPLVGDWNGDGVDTVGLYDPAHAAFFLRNSNNGGVADISFAFGPAGLGWLPRVGDWNADATDTIGLYDPAHAAFFLRNTNNGGVADVSFTFGPAGLGWIPLVGNWDGL